MTGCKKDSEKNKGVPVSMKFYLFSKQNQLKDISLGVIADFPVNADNLKYTINADGTMAAADQLRWGKGQSESSAFFFYAPYNSGYTGKSNISVAVQSDQSTLENLNASDFISAFTKSKPDNRGTDITLTHNMSIIQIPLATRNGEKVSQVILDGVIAYQTIDVKTGSTTLGTTKQKITAYKEPGTNSFSCIIPAQELSFKATVVFESGEQVTILTDKALQKWNGKIYRFDDITISANDKSLTILSSRANIKDWTSAGIPVNQAADPISHISDLLTSEQPNDKTVNFTMNGITATAIAENPELNMAIFEDESGATPIYLNNTLPDLEVGTKVSGQISVKFSTDQTNGSRIVTMVLANKAEIVKDQPVPLAECTFSQLPSLIDSITYRRNVFHNVTIESAFSKGSAVFTQDGVRVRVLCDGQDGLATKEGPSDLIGFPVIDGDSMAIYIPDHTALANFIVTREESGFTGIRTPGMYDISDMANPKVLFAYNGRNQLSSRKTSMGYDNQITDLKLNKSLFFETDGFEFNAGQTYGFFVEAYGQYDLSKGECHAECFFIDEDRIWFIDKDDRNIGYIMAYEK